ncbi:hypothetical protein TW80_16630 [Loktanella sp. S4079]|nr:hypothetical protein TW80_16630 [Loktanella sp. S4079]
MSQNLLSRKELVDGSSVFMMGRQRNRFFVFKQLHGPSYFIKQAHEGEPGTAASVTNEARIYTAVQSHDSLAPLRDIIPQLRHFDEASATLTLELIKDAENLSAIAHRHETLPTSCAKQMGAIAALYHRVAVDDIDHIDVAFERKPHWIFRLREDPSPLDSLRARSQASATIIDMLLDHADLCDLLARRKAEWQTDTLIHADFKWENFLSDPHAKGALRLLDWERADIGDAAWDVGCGLAAFVIHDMMRRPESDDRFDLTPVFERMQPFWQSYITGRAPDRGNAFFGKCADMMVARLLVAAYEHCYGLDQPPALAKQLFHAAADLISAPMRSTLLTALDNDTRCAA